MSPLTPASSQGSGSGIPGVTVTGTPAAGQALIATAADAATWSYPPGFEIGYDQITANVTVASTTEAAGTTVIACGAHTFDGGPVLVELYAPLIQYPGAAVGNLVHVSLFEGATQITRIATVATQETGATGYLAARGAYRFTPAAGAHTYTVTAFATTLTGAPTVFAGAAGTAHYPPTFVRFTKV